MNRSRRGAVERLSIRGRRDGPPWPPPLQGGATIGSGMTPGDVPSLFRGYFAR